MLQLILHLYIFLAWTGSWSGHSGIGALFFACLWIVTLILGLVCAFVAPSIVTVFISLIVRMGFGKEAGRAAMNIADVIDIAVNGVTFMLPILGVAGYALFGYFTGIGDYLSKACPAIFPAGGYLFSDASIPWYAFIAPLYLAWTYYSMLDRFAITDAIKESMPEVKSAAKEMAKETGQRSVVLWNAYSPTVKQKGGAALKAILREGRAFGLLNVELLRHVAMHGGLLATSGGVTKRERESAEPEKDSLADNLRHHIEEHRRMLKVLWHESRHFTISVWATTCLAVLVAIVC